MYRADVVLTLMSSFIGSSVANSFKMKQGEYEGAYRIHKSELLPAFIQIDITNEEIRLGIFDFSNKYFFEPAEYDPETGWFTIYPY